MLPSVLAKQLQEGLVDYIDTTFPITNSAFQDSLKNMLHSPDAVFHEPYIAVRLPFRVSDREQDTFRAIQQSYNPYVHQQKAFDRLVGEDGRSTLIATGTGSGKTECFLYPILEYCYRHRGEQGIKALIIYPMNALASDQAKRIAELVDGNPELKNNGIRVGMYVGGQEKTSAKVMMPHGVIIDHDTLITSPPDILMTNYKMLDYLLVRPKDAELWKNNGPDTLRYIAVDELHTFDGAQGTDLACLLRRLKSRLNMQQGQLCCIGTSATMGAKESEENIRKYAEDVFGESFEEDSVITEDRLTPEEFFAGYEVLDFTMPSREQAIKILDMTKEEDEQGYLELAVQSWLSVDIVDIMTDDARVQLGKYLMSHQFTQEVITFAKGNYIQNASVIDGLMVRFPELKEMEVDGSQETIIAALDALYALISHARIYDAKGELRPFLNVQVQLWMRELRRLMASVSGKNIQFALAGDLSEQQAKHYLPVVNCRDCGQTGWASLIDEQGCVEMIDHNTFYNHFFACESDVRMIFPRKYNETSEYFKMKLCPECLEVGYEENKGQLCTNGHDTIPVWIPELKTSGKGRGKGYLCPFCGSTGGLSLMGVRSATAISAGISELYSSKFNDDKKLLAFTDNVQDAAHHAGFYNARTWKFGLRTAIQQYALIETEAVSMEQFIKRCVAYWKKTLGREGFVAQFIPAGLTWMNGYERMCKEESLGNDEDASRVIDYVTKRMEYEILLEYGLSARIGRSLEKSGCSTVAFDYEDALTNIATRIPNEVGVLHDADIDTFDQLVMGVLYGMKRNGAFDYLSYHSFIENNGNKFIFSKIKWMPGARIGRNVPKMIAHNKSAKKLGYFEDVTKDSWFTKWIGKYMPIMHADDSENRIIKIVLEELTKHGLVNLIEDLEKVDVWAINPSKVAISRNVKQFICDECGSKVSVAAENAYTWSGMCCIRLQCNGHMEEMSNAELDFYGKLYSQGELIRIVAKEHTGLLKRDDREELEKTFKRSKEQKKPWDVNLLSCTPTLEMGIDIGGLSTVIMCSIPPGQSQYAQRAGRGGRKDGNALTVAVANARPHDLYFYEDPMEMIAGVVEPPRVFLRASAVLDRQFVAYCMDCWVKTGKAELPKNVGACLSNLNNSNSQKYPHNFLNYVQTNLTKLVRMFVQTFSTSAGNGGLDEDAIKDIRTFAIGDGQHDSPMYVKILEEFNILKKQRDSLKKNSKNLTAMIKELESKPKDSSYDDQIKDLKNERAALSHVIQNINDKDIFNFLSDVGLLPNYAFPEAGITLKAVLYRREENPEEGTKGKSEKMVYEFNRSAASAISEFAPLNSFYVAGRKLNIDQVDVNMDKPIQWRLCPNCAHAEPVDSTKIVTVCPKCQDVGWADAGQMHSMLKVQMVYSYSEYKQNLIDDSSEERTPKFFDKQMLVDVDENHDIKVAYKMNNDDFPFGYEYVQKATMREINYGEKDIVGEKLTVAGNAGVKKGFTICKYCGKIQEGKKAASHTKYCKTNQIKTPLPDPYEECLFLYREFQTEVIRLLVPATTLDSSRVRVESFVAAIMLGMKSKFGNVDHLRACVSEVPIAADADYRKQYLVLYDSVPGGTGYLKQLMNDKHGMIDILHRALDKMEKCSCRTHDMNLQPGEIKKDGCYRCLYAFRQSQHIGEISRDCAISMLKSILSGVDNLEEIPKLGNIEINSLFESELERRFIEAMRRLGTENRGIEVHKTLVNGKEGYSLTVGQNLWEIELQVELGANQGVHVDTRADFVLWPKRTGGSHKPIVIYTDGFLYHKDKVHDDTLKRMAVMLTGKYRVWSLSWKDVQHIFQKQGDYKTNTLMPEHMPMGAQMYRPFVKAAAAECINPDKENAFELLVDYLEKKDAEEIFKSHAVAYAFSIMDRQLMKSQNDYDKWKSNWEIVLDSMDSWDDIPDFGKVLYGQWEPRQNQGNIDVLASVLVSDMSLKMKAPTSVIAVLEDRPDSRTDKYDVDWNGFWHFVNIMQFNHNAYFVTTTGIMNSIYTVLGAQESIAENEAAITSENSLLDVDPQWIECIDEFIDDIAKKCATEMMNKHIPAPIVAYELVDEKTDVILACAEMVWEDKKIAWLLPEQEEYLDVFEKAGWRVILSTETIDETLFGGEVNE